MTVLSKLALSIPAIRRLHEGRNILLERLQAMQASDRANPFFHYHTAFDVEAIIRRHAADDVRPRAGYVMNFMGVAVDPKFCPEMLDGRAGEVEGLPIPGNWHADMAEFAAALRAVELARDRFTMIELGCGWGCWMNNTGAAARRAGLTFRLIGVEGDLGHIRFAEEARQANGFDEAQMTLHRGIAAASSGKPCFRGRSARAGPGVCSRSSVRPRGKGNRPCNRATMMNCR